MLRLTFELWLILTFPDGATRYAILDEGLTAEDCRTIIERLPLAEGYHLQCEETP